MKRRGRPARRRVGHSRRQLGTETRAPAPEVEIEITSIAAGGDGVGRTDGLVVFTPRTAPGDLARVRAAPVRGGRLARGTLVDLLRAADTRVDPPCTHYIRDRCGGCQLQHIRYEAQLEAKSGIVQDALTRIARRPLAHVRVRPSPTMWRYRRKLTLALRREESGRWIAGLHRFDAPDEVFELRECPITETAVLDVWRAVMSAADLLPASADRGAIRTTETGFAFVLEGGHRWAGAADLAAAVPALTEIWWVSADGQRRRMYVRDRDPHGAGGGAKTGASFVQVNSAMSAALHEEVVARVLAYHPATVIDAYAGTGDTAVSVAEQGVRVTAIEADGDAVNHCASRLPLGSRAVAARVEDALPRELPADVVVLNPPRQGVESEVAALLSAASSTGPRAIVYVSCDPATLARDVGRLRGWRISAVDAFDMFPQTAHVETICEMVPEASP